MRKIHRKAFTKKEQLFKRLSETPFSYLNGRLFCIDHVSVRDQWRIRRHEHSCFELVVCTSGRYSCTVNGQPVEISKGQSLLVKHGDTHEDTSRYRGELVFVKFYITGYSNTATHQLIFHPQAPARAFVIGRSSQIAGLIERIESIDETNELAGTLLQDSLTLALFWSVCSLLPAEVFSDEFRSALSENSFSMRLSMLCSRMADSRPSVGTIAREMAMSVSAFERMCRREMGMPPTKALEKIRMEKALRMICHTGRSIKEVSEILGYSHQNNFSNAFKRHFGKFPSFYRRQGAYPGVLHEEELPLRFRASADANHPSPVVNSHI